MGGQMPVNKMDYWARKKEEFLQKMQAQGFDLFEMQDFIENRGMWSMDEYILTQNLRNPAFVNPLKGMVQQPQV